MTQDLFDLLLASKVKTNDMCRVLEDYHFGKQNDSVWVKELHRYVCDQGGIFQENLYKAIDEYMAMKCDVTQEKIDFSVLAEEALPDIITFTKTPMSGYVSRHFPDVSSYFLQPLKNEKDETAFEVMYNDADRGIHYRVGELHVAVGSIVTEAKECHTRGKYGTKFWWVNQGDTVRYYLFTVSKLANERAYQYYVQCMEQLNKHCRKKENVFRSYEYEGGNSKVFS